jgi:hypothetical protein
MRLATTVRPIGAHKGLRRFWPKTPNSCVGIPYDETAGARYPSGRVGWPRRDTVLDIVLKYPIWQEPCRAAVIEANPKLLRDKIAVAEQAAILRVKQQETGADHHGEVIALTYALAELKILEETIWAE